MYGLCFECKDFLTQPFFCALSWKRSSFRLYACDPLWFRLLYGMRDTSKFLFLFFLQMDVQLFQPHLLHRLFFLHWSYTVGRPLPLNCVVYFRTVFCSVRLTLSTPSTQCLDHCSLIIILAIRTTPGRPTLFFSKISLVLVYIFLHPFTFKEKHVFWWGAENINEIFKFKVKFFWPMPLPQKKKTNTPQAADFLR